MVGSQTLRMLGEHLGNVWETDAELFCILSAAVIAAQVVWMWHRCGMCGMCGKDEEWMQNQRKGHME